MEEMKVMNELISNKMDEVMSETDPDALKKEMAELKEFVKLRSDLKEEIRKDESEKKKESSEKRKVIFDRIFKGVELGVAIVVPLSVPIIEVLCRKSYAHDICEFEKDYTFTTTAGRGLSSLFRFK